MRKELKLRINMKATAAAPSNIAFIKYWGKKDEKLRLPANSSISVNLSGLKTTTTVKFSKEYKQDKVQINGQVNKKESIRVVEHLDRIRKLAKIELKAKVVSVNNFPKSSGLASSASGFAALTVAATSAAGLKLSEKQLTILARLGSGSACRSIPDGFVEWIAGKTHQSSFARSIYPAKYWDISILVALVEGEKKKVSTTSGHKLARTSPFFGTRLKNINRKISLIKHLIKEKKFREFGQLVENESLEMHAIMLTSTPSLIYWQPATVAVMRHVRDLRHQGLPVYFTIDAGPHLFLICQNSDLTSITERLKTGRFIKKIILNRPARGIILTSNHLF